MKKLKKRIKRFLALWLKDELFEIIQYDRWHQVPQTLEMNRDFEVLRFTEVFDLQGYDQSIPPRHHYEQAVYNAKRKIADEAIKYIQVNSERLVSAEYINCRAIEMELLIGKRYK